MLTININVEHLIFALCEDLCLTLSTRNYILKRFRAEGCKFLTVTLPKLADSLLRSLDLGFFDRSGLTCFRWKGSALLHFQELTSLIFDSRGVLRADPDPVAVYRTRQLSHYLYKLALDFSERELAAAELAFIKNENELTADPYDTIFVDDLRCVIETHYKFPSFSQVLETFRPRYGPGTYSCGATFNSNSTTYYEYKRINPPIPHQYECVSGAFRPYPSCPERIQFTQSDSNTVSELLFVPKDSRGPRTIVREPLHQLRLQMAFFDFFSSYLQEKTEGRINFTDQSVNQKLARCGSRDGKWATLDLKDASDRISFKVVASISRNIPCLRWFVNHRSTHCLLPSGRVIRLSKLAGMGSGLTFVWLAFLVHSSVAYLISRRSSLTFSQASRLVYVYGDDLVVPSTWASCAEEALAKIGLFVNTKKSFTRVHCPARPLFRESCGGDFFGGEDVSIVRAKFTNSNPQIVGKDIILSGDSAVIEVNSHAKHLIQDGMLATAECYYHALERTVGLLPIVFNFESSVIGRYTRGYHVPATYLPDEFGNYPLVKVIVPKPVVRHFAQENPYVKLSDQFGAQVWTPFDRRKPHVERFYGDRQPISLAFKAERALGIESKGESLPFKKVAVPRQASLRFGAKVSALSLLR